jgi:uncharacterized membrane protein YbhN (UPF0104 family)
VWVVLLLALVLHEAIVEVWRRRSGVRVVLTGIVRPGLGLAILLLLLLLMMMSSRDRTAGSAGRAGSCWAACRYDTRRSGNKQSIN